jgi:hypothetical protein
MLQYCRLVQADQLHVSKFSSSCLLAYCQPEFVYLSHIARNTIAIYCINVPSLQTEALDMCNFQQQSSFYLSCSFFNPDYGLNMERGQLSEYSDQAVDWHPDPFLSRTQFFTLSNLYPWSRLRFQPVTI